jgi:hypothetical protein
MIDLRAMKRELEEMIEEREAMDENPDITMDELSDMDWRIEGQYRDIANVLLCDDRILDMVQKELEIQDDPDIDDYIMCFA